MGKLFPMSAEKTIKKLEKLDYYFERQKGSHVRMKCKRNDRLPVTIPVHGKREVSRGILRKIIRDANVSVEEWYDL